ncbi:RNA polymerase sigma factor [Coprobacter tertius]|uniref:RNA polymerase sigma factor n=1 Tax=Coprobacter tertius TaxID=2944915 RepID=A0ABT1MN44_9BACT|nr:RNA polymerase sigma factor [Coprobacter tertius]MCP9612711.1 RNA polymerase sigma factor [Coprobacter tertius]
MENFNLRDELVKLQARLLAYALFLTHNLEKAKELRQETNLKILMKEDCYIRNENFSGWCCTVMFNLHNDLYEKEKRLPTEPLDKTADISFDAHIGHEVDMETIRKAIGMLSESDREMLGFMMMKVKHKEVAQLMSIPVGTVKSRSFYVRTKLYYLRKWFGK